MLWQNHVNKSGGILNRQVNLLIHDDQSSKTLAAQLYAGMIEKDRVDLVIGPYSSGISEAVLPVTEKHGYPVLLSGASADHL